MLYVLPPPRAPDPPSPWDSILCANNSNNQDRSSWSNKKHLPKVRLRECYIVKEEVRCTFKTEYFCILN